MKIVVSDGEGRFFLNGGYKKQCGESGFGGKQKSGAFLNFVNQ